MEDSLGHLRPSSMKVERHLSLPDVSTAPYTMTPHRFATPCTPSVFTFDAIPETNTCTTPYSYRSHDYMGRDSEGQFFNRFNESFLSQESVDPFYHSDPRKRSHYLDANFSREGDFFQDRSPMLLTPRRSSLQGDDLFSSNFPIFPRAYSTSPAFHRTLHQDPSSLPSASALSSIPPVSPVSLANPPLSPHSLANPPLSPHSLKSPSVPTPLSASVPAPVVSTPIPTPTKPRKLHSRAGSPNKPSVTDPANRVVLENVRSGKDRRTTLMIKNIPNA